MHKICVIFILFFVSNSFAQSSSLNAKDTLMLQAIVDSMKIELKRQSNFAQPTSLNAKDTLMLQAIVDSMKNELKRQSNESSSKSTRELKKENETLRGIMKGYVMQIDSLNTLNLGLNTELENKTIKLNETSTERDKFKKEAEEKTKEEEEIRKFLKNSIQILNEEKEFRNITLEQLTQLYNFTANQTFLQNEKKSLTALVEFKKCTEAAENAYNFEYEEGLVTKCSEELKKHNLPIEMNKLKPFKDELTTNLLFYKGQLCVVKSIIEKVNKAYSKKEQSSFRLKTIEDETLYTRYLKYPNSFIFKALDTSVKEAKSIITFVCP